MAWTRIAVTPGEVFGRWTVLSTPATKRRYVLCRCACGTEREVWASNLRSGISENCGCIRIAPAAERFWRLR